MGIAVDAKVTAKGQITIPSEVRRALGVDAGDRVEFFVRRDGRVILHRRDKPVDVIFGRAGVRRAAAMADDEAVAAEVVARDNRSRRGRR